MQNSIIIKLKNNWWECITFEKYSNLVRTKNKVMWITYLKNKSNRKQIERTIIKKIRITKIIKSRKWKNEKWKWITQNFKWKINSIKSWIRDKK